MSIAFSWSDLGLARVWIEGAGSWALYDLEKGKKVSASPKDEACLRVHYAAENTSVVVDREVDLHLLSRALLPTLSEHNLDALCAHFEITDKGSEASRLVRLLQALILEAVLLDRAIVALLAQLLPSPIADVLMNILVIPRPEPSKLAPSLDEDEATSAPSPPCSAQDALAANGPIASTLDTFEMRRGQLRMVEAIDHAFGDGHAALIEAGPGTGKTFAYLIPAILHLEKNPSDRVVVSTRTRQLQEQLYGKDLPFLTARLMPDLEVALLKGRENYLCLRRWHALIDEFAESLERDILQPLLAVLVRWMVETETGDIEENSAFQDAPEARQIWRRLCDSPHHCTGAFCAHCEECFSVLARRRARRANLVVVNHSLLLGDLAVGNVVLGKYTHLVVDEAHTLESVARMAFTRELTERAFVRLADDLSPSGRRRRGWLQRTPFTGGKEVAQKIGDLLSQLRKQVAIAFKQLARNLPDERRADFSALTELADEISEMPILLSQLESALDSLSDHIEEEEPKKELEGFIRVVQGLKDTVSTMLVPPSENTVHWFERSPHTLAFYATPLEVAPFLESLLYPKLKSLVLTSATLSLAGSFDYLCRSIGLTEDAFEMVSLIAESPFAYEDRMRILVPLYMPPAHGNLLAYAQSVAELISGLSERTGKNGLALFTSYAMMQAVKEYLPPDVNTLVQGEVSRRALIEQFRGARRPMWLLGTESFWEGVDFPGEELEILLISRLPFPVPTDPVLAAMGDRLIRAGRDPFMELSLPLAGMKLRQGVGRLIRTAGDRGLVFLTDQRIVTRGYGKRLAKSLPVKIETVEDPAALLTDVAQWFDSSIG